MQEAVDVIFHKLHLAPVPQSGSRLPTELVHSLFELAAYLAASLHRAPEKCKYRRLRIDGLFQLAQDADEVLQFAAQSPQRLVAILVALHRRAERFRRLDGGRNNSQYRDAEAERISHDGEPRVIVSARFRTTILEMAAA